MTLWKDSPTPELINQASEGSMAAHLGIVITEIGEDFLRGQMPVDGRTRQPMGLMHGGASATLAETLGSIAGLLTLENDQYCVGIELNVSHLRSVTQGKVTGTARPVKIGRTVQVWETRILDEEGRLASIARLTLLVRSDDDQAAGRLHRRLGSAAP